MKTIDFIHLNELNSEDLKELFSTTIKEGRMKRLVRHVTAGEVVFAWVARKYQEDSLVGWCSLEDIGDRILLSIYVRPAYRRTGKGKELAYEGVKFYHSGKAPFSNWPLITQPWDSRGRLFFNSIDLNKR